MKTVNNSKTLMKILDLATNLGTQKTLSVERFLLVLTDVIETAKDMDMELIYAKQELHNRGIDISIAKRKLMGHVLGDFVGAHKQDEQETDFVKRIFNAQVFAMKQGAPELTVGSFLKQILDDPNETIQNVLNVSIVKKQGKKSPLSDGRMHKSSIQDESEGDKDMSIIVDELDGMSPDEVDKILNRSFFNIMDADDKQVRFMQNKAAMDTLVSDVKQLRKKLLDSVFGQDNAVNQFVTGYFQANLLSMFDPSRQRPKATFLFAGPPGVGKTFLAETVADALHLPFCRFDMSEYADKEANLEFCGSDKVYKDGKVGNVTSFVDKNPECVLLFDEIEKAHINVIHLFLQMLDAGRLRDNYNDKEISFSKVIIILTTNAGRQLYEESECGDFSSVSRKVIINALQTDVKPDTGVPLFQGAICSRFASGNVVMFNHISAHNLTNIAKREIERRVSSLEYETGIKMQIDEKVYAALLFSEGSSADARTIRSRAETFSMMNYMNFCG